MLIHRVQGADTVSWGSKKMFSHNTQYILLGQDSPSNVFCTLIRLGRKGAMSARTRVAGVVPSSSHPYLTLPLSPPLSKQKPFPPNLTPPFLYLLPHLIHKYPSSNPSFQASFIEAELVKMSPDLEAVAAYRWGWALGGTRMLSGMDRTASTRVLGAQECLAPVETRVADAVD